MTFVDTLTTAQREALNRTGIAWDAPFERAVTWASVEDMLTLTAFRETPDVRQGFGKLNPEAFAYLVKRAS